MIFKLDRSEMLRQLELRCPELAKKGVVFDFSDPAAYELLQFLELCQSGRLRPPWAAKTIDGKSEG